jgi:hypothetical protein
LYSAWRQARAGRTKKAITKTAPSGIACTPGAISLGFAKPLQKGQLITLEGKIKYRKVSEAVDGVTFKHSIAEIHATSMKRLSRVEAADDPADGASENDGARRQSFAYCE